MRGSAPRMSLDGTFVAPAKAMSLWPRASKTPAEIANQNFREFMLGLIQRRKVGWPPD